MLLFIQVHIIFYLVASPPLLKRRESEGGAFNSGIGLYNAAPSFYVVISYFVFISLFSILSSFTFPQ